MSNIEGSLAMDRSDTITLGMEPYGLSRGGPGGGLVFCVYPAEFAMCSPSAQFRIVQEMRDMAASLESRISTGKGFTA